MLDRKMVLILGLTTWSTIRSTPVSRNPVLNISENLIVIEVRILFTRARKSQLMVRMGFHVLCDVTSQFLAHLILVHVRSPVLAVQEMGNGAFDALP